MITESEFLGQVIDLAHIYGWKCVHFRPAMTSKGWRTAVQADGKGFPDLFMIRENRIIFAELKSDNGKLSSEQVDWLNALQPVGEVFIWKPEDFEQIIDILKH